MEEVEVSDDGDYFLNSHEGSDCDNSISEEESLLYSLIYHEQQEETDKGFGVLSNNGQIIEDLEFTISCRSKVYRLNEVQSIDKLHNNSFIMSSSRAVRNHIKEMKSKLETMRQKRVETVLGKQSSRKICAKPIKTYKISMENSKSSPKNGEIALNDLGKRVGKMPINSEKSVTAKQVQPVETDCENVREDAGESCVVVDIPEESVSDMSKYAINLNNKYSSVECEIIVLDSDEESVSSVIEVKPPTPPPPVVIDIDSADESQKKQTNNFRKTVTSGKHISTSSATLDYTEEVILIDELLPPQVSNRKPSDIGVVATVNVNENVCVNTSSSQMSGWKENSISSEVNKKRKTKNSKNRDKSTPRAKSQCVPRSWTKAMTKFYCESWGGHKFDHEALLRQMPGNTSQWKVLDIDLLGPFPRQGPYANHRCFNCNQKGHTIKQCPDPIKKQCCLMCGQQGHNKHSCPNKICLQCGRPADAFSYGCTTCCSENFTCDTCGENGHFMLQCPKAWRVFHSATSSKEVDSPMPVDLKQPAELFCCNCARAGHSAFDCKFPSNFVREICASKSKTLNASVFKYKYYRNNFKYNQHSGIKTTTKLKKYSPKNGNLILSTTTRKTSGSKNHMKKLRRKLFRSRVPDT